MLLVLAEVVRCRWRDETKPCITFRFQNENGAMQGPNTEAQK